MYGYYYVSVTNGTTVTFGNYWGYGAMFYGGITEEEYIIPPMQVYWGDALFYNINISSNLGPPGSVSVYPVIPQKYFSVVPGQIPYTAYLYAGTVGAAYTVPLGTSTSISPTFGIFAAGAVSISSEYCGPLYFYEDFTIAGNVLAGNTNEKSGTANVIAALDNSTWAYLTFYSANVGNNTGPTRVMLSQPLSDTCYSPGTYLLIVSIYLFNTNINYTITNVNAIQVSTSNSSGGASYVPVTQYALSIPVANDTLVNIPAVAGTPYDFSIFPLVTISVVNTTGSPAGGYFSMSATFYPYQSMPTSPFYLHPYNLFYFVGDQDYPWHYPLTPSVIYPVSIVAVNCPKNVYFLPASLPPVVELLTCSGISPPPSSAYPAYYPTDYSNYAPTPAYLVAWPTGPATFSFLYNDTVLYNDTETGTIIPITGSEFGWETLNWTETAQNVWSAAVYISSFSITSVSSPYADYTNTSALPYNATSGKTYVVTTGAPWLYYTGPLQINGGISGASTVIVMPYGVVPPTTPAITLNGTARMPLVQGFNPTNPAVTLVPTSPGYYVNMPTCYISSNPYGGAAGTYGLYNCIATTYGALTAVVWFYLPPGGSGVILGFFGGGGAANLLYVGYDGRLYGGDAVPGYAPNTISTALPPGWHMAAVEEWYSGGAYYYSLYLDGSLVGQTSFSMPTLLFGGGGPYGMNTVGFSPSGRWPGLAGPYSSYTGLVAFVALYNTALNQSQIQQIYAAGFPSALFRSNLVAAYYLSPQYYNGGYFTPYFANGTLLAKMGVSNANAYTYTPSGAQGNAASQLVPGTAFSFLGVPGRLEAFGATPNGAGVYYIQSNLTSYIVPPTAGSSALYIPLTAGIYIADNIGNWWNTPHSPYTASLAAASPPPYIVSVNGIPQYAYNVAWNSQNPPAVPIYMTGADGKTYAFVPSWVQQLGLSKILAGGGWLPALYVWGRPISQSALAFASKEVWLNYTQASGPYAYFPYLGSPGSMTVYANSTSAVGSWALQIVGDGLSPSSASSANVTVWMSNGAPAGSFFFPRPFSYLAFPVNGSLGPLWLLLNSTIGVPPYIVQRFPSITQLAVSRGGYTAVSTSVSVPSQLFNQWSGNLVLAAAWATQSGSYAIMSGGFYSPPPTSFTIMLPTKAIGQLAYFLMASWPSGGTCVILQQVTNPLHLTICQGTASQNIEVNLAATVSGPAFTSLAGAWAGLAERITPISIMLANAGVAALIVLMIRRGRSLTAGLMTAGALVTALGLSLWLPWMIGEGAVMFVIASAAAFTRR
jgi:hypothetical protein